jgi:hypothetical protein
VIDKPTAAQDAWILNALGTDLGRGAGDANGTGEGPQSRRTASQQFVTGIGNVAGTVVSEMGIGAEAVDQGTRNLLNKAVSKSKYGIDTLKAVVGWGPPPTALPTGPVALTSQTEEAQPANRARTRLGVGERVVLTVTGGPGNWLTSGGSLSAALGTQVTLTAPPRPGSLRVSVDVGGTRRTLDFKVIAPSEVHMVVTATNFHVAGLLPHPLPNAGMNVGCYIGPDDVNFVNTENYEDDIRARADGYWDEFNGVGHGPSPTPNGCSGTVLMGMGTHSPGDDQIRSGYISQPVPPNGDWSGTLTFNIPWHWKCGTASGLIGRITHRQVTDAAGSTTVSKGGAQHTEPLS